MRDKILKMDKERSREMHWGDNDERKRIKEKDRKW